MTTTMNVGHVLVLLHFGNMPRETVLYNTRRFAEDVIPRLRGKFSEWDDHWWPTTGLEQPVAPGAAG
jgi:hypothetical protein